MAKNYQPIAVFIGHNIHTHETREFHGVNELKEAGFTESSVYKCLNGKLEVHKSHTWKRGESIQQTKQS